ncbi:FAD-binding domain-containing protein [Cladorrhinum sp. PSN332]|nr:FAD-binding domain-containing protein [Cladorrhinum sp. PSN332]
MYFSDAYDLLQVALGFSSVAAASCSECRSIPGDAAWPCSADWAGLNSTIDGRLVATIPIGAVCHNTFASEVLGSVTTYDAAKCDELRNNWHFPETHLTSPGSSPMQYSFTNNSCNPFDPDPNAPCTIGGHPVYAINATEPSHLQAGVAFAKKHNIRPVIRNTGHDYLGKSTGPHSLALWTQKLKSTELIPSFPGASYTGPAIKLGAGVPSIDAYRFASSHGLVVLGGNCPTVGIAGGYTQGGGIGPLSSLYGLASDQVLEWTVITANGDLITANSTNHPDLFWALRGGGGGTFGIVTSMTVKAFPDKHTSSAFINVANSGTNTEEIYTGFQSFISTQLPALVDEGVYVLWVLTPLGFIIQARFAFGKTQSELDALLAPTVQTLTTLNLNPEYVSLEFPDFLTAYETTPGGQWNVSDYSMGGRLVPRSVVTDPAKAGELVSAIRHVASQTLITGVSFNVGRSVSSPDEVAANPHIRDSLFNIVLGVPTNYTDWQANLAGMNAITRDFQAGLEAAAPGGGAYLNEADVQQPDWESEFYGEHWERLSGVKREYDLTGVFYARTAVGSEQWVEREDGRLCRLVESKRG